MYGLQATTVPATAIVSVAEQKSHMRLLGRDANDPDVLAYLLFAESYVTSLTNHVFQPTTYRYTLDRPPAQYGYRYVYNFGFRANAIEFPVGPLLSVGSITYKVTDPVSGLYVDTLIDPATYQVSATQIPGRVMPRGGQFWPFGSVFALEGMVLTFTAGYASPANVPPAARMAVKLLAGYMYENREPLTIANVVGSVPITMKHLTDNLKLSGYV